MNNPFELIDARLSNIETLLLDIKHNRNAINTRIEHLKLTEFDFSVRVLNIFSINGLNTASDLINLTEKQFMSLKNVGKRSLDEVKHFLQNKKLHFKIYE